MALETLESVPWDDLNHAYGSAGDIPATLRALAGNDVEDRRQALNELYGNIFHQGTRYQASPHAIPFLFELAGYPDVADRAHILILLAHLALGYPDDSHLPWGVDPGFLRKSLLAADESMTPSERESCGTYHYGPLIDLACYDAVLAGLPALLPLLEHPDEDLRCASAYLFSWFPDLAAASLPALVISATESRLDRDGAHALIAIGMLGVDSLEEPQFASLVSKCSAAPSQLVRTAAAIATYRRHPEGDVQEALIQALLDARKLTFRSDELWFNEGNLAGHVALIISDAPEWAHERLVPALGAALKAVNPYQSLDVTRALLDLLTGGPDERRDYFSRRSASELTARQRCALESIRDYGGWRLETIDFANYSELLQHYGLPGSQDKLRIYLKS